MASIKSQMILNDGMSAVLNKISNALNTTLASLEQVQRASGKAMDVARFEQARMELVGANRAANSMAEAFREASNQQEKLGNTMNQLVKKAISQGVDKAITFIKEVTAEASESMNVMARLSQNLSNRGMGQNEFDSITLAAKEYTYYGGTAMQAAGAEFANYLGDDQAIISMMDTLSNYAVGMSGGGELDVSQMTDYASQLGAVLTGSYEGIEQKGFALTEVQKEIIANGTGMERAAVIADVINEKWGGLYETMAGTPAGKIQELNIALNDIKETAGFGIYPALMNIVDVVSRNLPQIQGAVVGFATALGFILNLVGGLIDSAVSFGSAVADNWGIIAPIIMAIVGVMGVYLAATKGVALVQTVAAAISAAYHAVQTFLSIGFGILTGNTAAASAAVLTFNSALMASPVTWIIIAIIALIAIFYAAVAAVNKFAGTSYSATGLIAGAFLWLMALIGNIVIGTLNAIIQYLWTHFVEPFLSVIEWILNVCNGGFDSFGDAVANLIGQVISWFLSLGKVVTKIIDAIFGTNWTAGLSSLQDSVLAWGKNENAITLDRNAPTINHRFDMTDAFDMGNKFGKGIEDKVGGLFDFEPGTAEDFTHEWGGLNDNVSDIADSSAATAGALNVSNEQLEYLRDIAERDAINRFTTAEVKIDMTGMSNRIDSSADLDGIISQLADGFTEALLTAAEGVHA